MRGIRLVLVAIEIAYLVHVGLLMLILPWSEPWPHLLLRLPATLVVVLDAPAARGAISAFGALHLFLVAAQIVFPRTFRHWI